MKRSVLFSLILVLVLKSAISVAADTVKVTGIWKLNVPDAPYDYINSKMLVTEASGKIAVKLEFADGQSVSAASVTLLNDVLKFSVTIDGNEIPFTGKISGNVLSGTVETPEGVMDVKGEKVTLTGTWDYNAPDAPYGYSTGKLVFEEKAGKPAAKVIMAGGYEMPVSDLKVNGTSFKFFITVEAETVEVSGKLAGEKIIGKAEYTQGQIDLSAVRANTKK